MKCYLKRMILTKKFFLYKKTVYFFCFLILINAFAYEYLPPSPILNYIKNEKFKTDIHIPDIPKKDINS